MAETLYPGFDVMDEQEAWDAHTRAIVRKRHVSSSDYRFLTGAEAELLHTVVEHLLHESRRDVLRFILSHIDARCSGLNLESQRKADVPPEPDLVRDGCTFLDAVARARHGKTFVDCGHEAQFAILAATQKGEVEKLPDTMTFPQKAFFKKVLSLAAQALASHSVIWSEMGYAGPAYPRGYYRIERGLTDPWEARRDDDDGSHRRDARI